MQVQISLKSSPVRAVSLRIHSALGAPLRADLEISSADPLDGEALVGTPACLEITGDEGSIASHHGIIASLTAVATANPDAQRQYTLDIRSAIEWLRLRKNARVFRKMTAVAIVKEVLAGVGIDGEAFLAEVGEDPPEREYVTQWQETDAVFLRRICEEDGLFFRFDPKDGLDAFVLCDRSSDAPAILDDPLPFVDATGLRADQRIAYDARHLRRRRVGKVSVRDYDPSHPAVKLEGASEGGLASEKSVEVYEAPGRFRTEREGKRAARLRLEALRADADTLQFETTALALRQIVLVGASGDEVVLFGALRTKEQKHEEVVVEAERRLVLRAGKAKLELSADGKVRLSGNAVTVDAPHEVRIVSAHLEVP